MWTKMKISPQSWLQTNLTDCLWHHYDFNILAMTSINEKMLTVFFVICNSYFAYVKLWVLNKRYYFNVATKKILFCLNTGNTAPYQVIMKL